MKQAVRPPPLDLLTENSSKIEGGPYFKKNIKIENLVVYFDIYFPNWYNFLRCIIKYCYYTCNKVFSRKESIKIINKRKVGSSNIAGKRFTAPILLLAFVNKRDWGPSFLCKKVASSTISGWQHVDSRNETVIFHLFSGRDYTVTI